MRRSLENREKFIGAAKTPRPEQQAGVLSFAEVERLVVALKESGRLSNKIKKTVRQAGNNGQPGEGIKVPIMKDGKVVLVKLINPGSLFTGIGEATREIETALKHVEDDVLAVLLNSYDSSVESERSEK